jgi:hypothetical protein
MRFTMALCVATLAFATLLGAAGADAVDPFAASATGDGDASATLRRAVPTGPELLPSSDSSATGSSDPSVPISDGADRADATLAAASTVGRPTDVASILDPRGGGTLVAPGTALAGAGPTQRYSVEVDASLGLDVDEVRAIVDAALSDGDRSWARTRSLQRTDDPTSARIRIILAAPETVDAICAKVGLDTAGIFSCWTGRIAALNAWRWDVGAAGFPDIATYRTYLVNHEVGHALGYAHVGCPGPGALAPVMMQQSKGLRGCVANGWPYP